MLLFKKTFLDGPHSHPALPIDTLLPRRFGTRYSSTVDLGPPTWPWVLYTQIY